MMRSMFSGVSGLKSHQTRMDTIGNNISNVNTVGYKATTTHFAETYSQLSRGAGSPQDGLGGTNPHQVGLGVGVSSMDVDHSNGSSQRTDRPTDLMIEGNGFFVVTNDVNYQNRLFTRAGNLTTDRMGFLVTAGGYKVLGEDMTPIRIDRNSTKTGTATSGVEISGNINIAEKVDEATNIAYSTSMNIHDNLGASHTVTINFGQRIDYEIGGEKGSFRNIQFSNEYITGGAVPGKLGNLAPANLVTGVVNPEALYAKFDGKGEFLGIFKITNIDTTTHKATGETLVPNLSLNMEVPATTDVEVKLFDNSTLPVVNAFKELKHYPAKSDVKGKKVDGNSAGFLDEFTISRTGEIFGIYTNGERQVLGRIVLAAFDNNAGLQKQGSNLFVDTTNSGQPKYGVPGSSNFGFIAGGSLEMSNVDLSSQFTDMITTQRGFQANSRVITTTDEMLQELVNLKR